VRVGYLVNHYPKVSHSFIRREILALESLGVAVVRVASRGWDDALVDEADEAERGKTHYLLKSAGRALLAAARRLVLSPRRFARAARRAVKMAHMSPRPVHVHLAYLVQACRLCEIADRERMTHLHAHFGTNSAEVAMLCAELGGPGYSFTVHGPEEFDLPAGLHLGEKIANARFVAAVSSFGRSQLFRWIPHAQWPKVRVVRCGLEEGYELDGRPVPPDSRTVVCVGRLCEQKGQGLLLTAARELARRGAEFELVLAGDGEMRAQLESLIDEYELRDRVRITGWVNGDEVRSLLLQSRALILPSFAEGLPVVIMEAMALGRPVITTQVAGIPELVRDGEEGWLVPAGDCRALVRAWEELLDTDAARLDAMGAQARQRVLQRHSALAAARKLKQLFETEAKA
jgi:glycosyltransferase involved in cell wall biosynthesis